MILRLKCISNQDSAGRGSTQYGRNRRPRLLQVLSAVRGPPFQEAALNDILQCKPANGNHYNDVHWKNHLFSSDTFANCYDI